MIRQHKRRSRFSVALVAVSMLASVLPPAGLAYWVMTSEPRERAHRSTVEEADRERLVRLGHRLEDLFDRLDAGGVLSGKADPALAGQAEGLTAAFEDWLSNNEGVVRPYDRLAEAGAAAARGIAELASSPSQAKVDRLNARIDDLNRALSEARRWEKENL